MKSNHSHIRRIQRYGAILVLLLCLVTEKARTQVHTEITPGITIDIQGMIQIESNGNWLIQGTILPGESSLLFDGPHAQILQVQSGTIHDLTIHKVLGDIMLASDIHVEAGIVSIVQQDVSLNGYDVVLDPGSTLSEEDGQTIKGLSGNVRTTRNIHYPLMLNVAGMGLEMTVDVDLGLTTVSRGHAAHTSNGHQSIHRYFDVIPQVSHEIELLTFYYDESELNGNDESQLQLYRSPDGGVNWIAIEGILDTDANSYLVAGVNAASRFTMSSYCLETCMATEAMAHSANLYLNAAGLALLTPQDINQNSRGACGIDTMWVFPEVFSCTEVGQQEVVLTVVDINGCSRSTTTTIEVVDQVAPEMHCKPFTLYLDESCHGTLYPLDIDDGSADACGLELTINQTIFDCTHLGINQVVLTGFDPSGNMAQCTASVEVLMQLPEVVCEDAFLTIGNQGELILDPFDLISGDPDDYVGFQFSVAPGILYCNELGDHLVTLTITDPIGQVSTCEVTVHVAGPDQDCDYVSDACDLCHGGDDQQDSDNNGVPDCTDWNGWANLVVEWQCASNKVFICHEGNVLCVNQNAVQAHLDHGDILGPCSAVFCENAPSQVNEDAYFVDILHEGEILDPLSFSFSEELPTGIEENVIVENYPNPFYPSSTIRFYLPADDHATLVIFDINGQRVATLMNGDKEKGWHEVVFDGRSHADGMYCYQLRLHHKQITNIMIMARK